MWQEQDGVLAGGGAVVRAAAFGVGGQVRGGVTLTLQVPDGAWQPLDGGGASATLLLGPDEATVRPSDLVCSTFTFTVEPRLREFRPLTCTAHDPLQPPTTTLSWFLADGTAAKPSMPVCAGGVVETMLPLMAPYQV